MRIMIDPGHGGNDPGARNAAFLLSESKVVLSYGLFLKTILNGHTHQISMTRQEDTFITLPDRVNKAHDFGADVFISLHCNAPGKSADYQKVSGIEIWTSPGQTESDELATMLYEQIGASFPDKKLRKDMEDGDPDREARFYVLRKTSMPAVLLELGFITNDMEANWLRDFGTIHRYCQAIQKSLFLWAPWRKRK